MPGCLARLLGGVSRGRGNLVLDGPAGPLLGGRARANRFRGAVTENVRPAARDWEVDAALTVTARGLARPVLCIFGRKPHRAIDKAIDTFWAGAPRRIDELETR